jgi:hypothetical protein
LTGSKEAKMTEELWDADELEEEELAEVFGDPRVDPSLYRCGRCRQEVLAAEAHWSQDGRALCPRCGGPLDPAINSITA